MSTVNTEIKKEIAIGIKGYIQFKSFQPLIICLYNFSYKFLYFYSPNSVGCFKLFDKAELQKYTTSDLKDVKIKKSDFKARNLFL